jgi:hypothetical protein
MGTKAVMERLGPPYSNFNLWQRKIKESFNPNMVSKPTPQAKELRLRRGS